MDSYDLFGRSISFSLKGNDIYRSRCGGLTSLIIYALMVLYLAIIITQPLQANTGAVSSFTNDDTEANTIGGSQSAGDVTIGGVNFYGTYSYKKLEYHYNSYKDSNQYNVYSYGYNIAVGFKKNVYDHRTMYFEFFALVDSPEYAYTFEYLDAMN